MDFREDSTEWVYFQSQERVEIVEILMNFNAQVICWEKFVVLKISLMLHNDSRLLYAVLRILNGNKHAISTVN